MGPAILAAATFLLLWPFARLDFDRHHDGYMLAQAVAVHQGELIHADAFAQYGPVTPWLQSAALFLPLGPALALRALNVAFISMTVFLLADMGRHSPKGWPVSRAVGWWAAIAWLVLADLWLARPMLPWSSTLTALLSVATLYLLTRSVRYGEDGNSRAASISGFAGGVLLGLMPFTRINVGLSAVAVCLLVAALTIFSKRSSERTVAKSLVVGAFASSLTVVLILFWTDALAVFYTQSIAWPLAWGSKATGTLQTQAILTKAFTRQALPVALVCGALFLQSRVGAARRGWSVSRSGTQVFTVLVGLIILIWENAPFFVQVSGSSWRSAVPDLISYLRTPNIDFIYFFMVLAAALAVITCITALSTSVRARSARKLMPWLLVGGLALSGLTQIIPTWDPRHVWWAAPIGLLLVFSVVRKMSTLNRPVGNPLMLPLLGTLAMAVFSGSAYLGHERAPGPPGSVIEGMRVSKMEVSQISADRKFLGQQLQGPKPVVYLVDDGDLSILDGRYRSADSYFVAWGGSPQMQTRTVNGDPLVVQRSIFTDGKISDLARSIRYEVVARNQRLVVLKPMAGATG